MLAAMAIQPGTFQVALKRRGKRRRHEIWQTVGVGLETEKRREWAAIKESEENRDRLAAVNGGGGD